MDLPEPEPYNVLHIGEESAHPMDKAILLHAKRGFLARGAALLALGMMMLFGFAFQSSVKSSLNEDGAYIASLIDEVGTLSQANFNLQQQVTSQEAVLQSIEGEFTGLTDALSSGDYQAVGKVFAQVLEEFSTREKVPVSREVDLSSTNTDSTLDFLILGRNGAHTDTIMVASVNKEKEKISLFSIPRDLYINGRRINAYYYYYGADQLMRMVEAVTGLKMDHYVEVDLNAFVEIIDILGGVDIYVSAAINDGSYPNGRGGYDPYSIEVGEHHMSGAEALKYARSRKSTSDFNRAERQQEILEVVRSKLGLMEDSLGMKEISQLFQAGLSHTETDLNLLDAVSAYYDYKDYELNRGLVLSSGNYLYSMINESGAYILLPNDGNFEEIKQVVAELVN